MTSVVHIVLVAWREGLSAEVIERVREAAQNCVGAIDGIDGLQEGPSVSPEGKEEGFDWGLVITFADDAARDAYLPHPVHRVLADQIGANAERVVVYDIAGS
jgi:hypothetical protein